MGFRIKKRIDFIETHRSSFMIKEIFCRTMTVQSAGHCHKIDPDAEHINITHKQQTVNQFNLEMIFNSNLHYAVCSQYCSILRA